MFNAIPAGMSRRHFMSHVAGASALMAAPAINFTNTLMVNAQDMRQKHKAAILLWMGGGPSTIDLWDLKPGAPTGGQFKPIATSADGVQICEHLPEMAKLMKHMSIVRSMSTREADHGRGRYYMHTGYVPNPNIEHPGYGSVIAHELVDQVPYLEIPPFVSVGGGSVGPGFLGMTWAPFVVNANGDVRDLNMGLNGKQLALRRAMLDSMESNFIAQNRGPAALDHLNVQKKTWNLMTSKQMDAFRVNNEPQAVRDRYGMTGFGRSCLMARRLVEVGVPFVEVDLGGWDNHNNIFPTLQNQKLPEMDKAMSALVGDLVERGMWQDTVVIWMGEFGRTPRINGAAGRDHWARSWSVVVGGGGFKQGLAVGQTNSDGTEVTSEAYTSQDLMASVLKALDISLETTFTSKNGRPMKIANSGKVIKELFA
ncbi:MAG: DUF1501 domain-containing protein [Pirellulales bacterium]|nr:DUF1501 domain-containing protein [Pirellulales bacterium]